jgi:hypothetical protein
MMSEDDPTFPLEEEALPLGPVEDARPRLPEPLPVKLIAVEDVRLPAQAGTEKEMDKLYVGLLEFVKEDAAGASYRADNLSVHFQPVAGLVERDSYRPLQIEVLSLRDTEKKLVTAEREYERQRGLTPGSEVLVMLDPSGNPLVISEARRIL